MLAASLLTVLPNSIGSLRHTLLCNLSRAGSGTVHSQRRWISEEQLSASEDHLQDIFQRNLDKASRRKPEDDRPVFLTTRREALRLYREILRYSNLFVWKDERGRTWREVIRESTRKEYEAARMETDPEIINKLIITGRECVQRTVESFMKKRHQIIEEEAARPAGPPSS